MEEKELSDLELARSYAKFEEGSVERIYTRFAVTVAGYAKNHLYGIPEADINNFVQDFFVSHLPKAMLNFRRGQSLDTFIYRVLNFRVIDLARKHIRKSETSLDPLVGVRDSDAGEKNMPSTLASGTDTVAEIIEKEEQIILHDALNSLDVDKRICLELFHFEKLSYKEIADLLQITVSNVKTRLYRGLNELKEIIAHRQGTR